MMIASRCWWVMRGMVGEACGNVIGACILGVTDTFLWQERGDLWGLLWERRVEQVYRKQGGREMEGAG